MKNKILLSLVFVLVVIYIKQERSIINTSLLSNKINVVDTSTLSSSSLDIEDYVIGVVAGEMPASFDVEALKAQAIAARTYAYYKINNSPADYQITNDTSSQVYITQDDMYEKWGQDFNKYYQKIKDAVNSTKDIVITYDNKVISSYYFSMSNGYTESALNVFKEDKPYLISKSSTENKNLNNFEYTKFLSKSEFCSKISITCDEIIIESAVRDESNRIETIVINNNVYTGIELRKLLSLRSTDFNIELNNDNVNITTYGYGHGVGMSQYGANEMAKQGLSYQKILNYYYDNTKLQNINSII